MGHLMKLEMQKFKLNRYVIGIIIAAVCMMIFITISLLDSAFSPKQIKDSYEEIFKIINLLAATIFLVYAAVLTSVLIISEYNNKTILLLFSYPINRKKLIVAKLLMVCIFIVSAMVFSTILCTIYLIGLDHFYDLVRGDFSFGILRGFIPSSISNIICCGFLCLIPFTIGMWKKSVPMTITSALGVIFLRQLMITSNAVVQETLWQLFFVMVLSIGTTCFTLHKYVNQIDPM